MKRECSIASGMKRGGSILAAALLLSGCETARTVGQRAFHVIDTPNRYIRERLASDDDRVVTQTTTTTTYDTDYVPPPPPSDRRLTERDAPPRRQPSPSRRTPASPPRSSSAPATTSLPYAKPVPGKAGYVFSPYDPKGGYVDVTGYSPGSKVKDPYTGKIFLVP